MRRKAVESNPSDTQTPLVVQENHYDPFGLDLTGLNLQPGLTASRFTYNGKEEQQGLGWLDYGARMYDPAIGRWNTIDPLTEAFQSVSAFSYGLNNPVVNIDPGGDSTVPYTKLNMYTFDTRKDDVQLPGVVVRAQQTAENRAQYADIFANSPNLQRAARTRLSVNGAPEYRPPASGAVESDYTIESYLIGGKLLKPVIGALGTLVGRLDRSSTIYRAVSKAEVDDIAQFGLRNRSGAYETGKLFAPTIEEAAKFGRNNFMFDGIPNTIMKVRVPNNVLNKAYKFPADGMNAISIPVNQLPLLRATPLNYSPLVPKL